MKLKKCFCGYTLEENCKKCGKVRDAHYKFVKIKDIGEIRKRKKF